MRNLLLATLVLSSGWLVSEARAQTGPGYGGGAFWGGGLAPAYYSGGYAYGGSYLGGGAWQGFGPPLAVRASIYPGYRGHVSYGYRAIGRGRTFGAYPPRFYPIYQPRPYGMFDR